MALMPYTNMSQDFMQPGANGAMFINDGIPGHRHDGQRINRSNTQLNINDHDVLNFKYGLDPRLPDQFRYGWAYGFNAMVIPKGRLVAADPYLLVMDTDTSHYLNAITIANGGKNVRLAQPADFEAGGCLENFVGVSQFLIGKIWVELEEELNEDEEFLKANGGNVGVGGVPRRDVRPANVPIGMIERNEYTRFADAFNGMTFGPIRTDPLVELPWFIEGEKALKNPWGSVVGNVKPGDLLCSDENGRFVLSPLSKRHPDHAAVMADMDLYEEARRQVVGEVYATDMSLLPEGAARFAQWALDDRKRFNDFNPYVYPTSNRAGEDFVENPPTLYQSDFRYPGYPYDRTPMMNDLHMLASSREGLYSSRFDEAHRLDRGIPGLLDGANAVIKAYGSSLKSGDVELAGDPLLKVSTIGVLAEQVDIDDPERREIPIVLPDTKLEAVKIQIGKDPTNSCVINETLAPGAVLECGKFDIVYADLHKGLIMVKQREKADKADMKCPVFGAYVKRGEAGVPTNLDWDGCKGTVRILMNK